MRYGQIMASDPRVLFLLSAPDEENTEPPNQLISQKINLADLIKKLNDRLGILNNMGTNICSNPFCAALGHTRCLGFAGNGINRGNDEDDQESCGCVMYPWGLQTNPTRMTIYEYSMYSKFLDQLPDPAVQSERHMVTLLHYLVDLLVQGKRAEAVYRSELVYKRERLNELLAEVNGELSQRRYLDSLFREFLKLGSGEFPSLRLVGQSPQISFLFWIARTEAKHLLVP